MIYVDTSVVVALLTVEPSTHFRRLKMAAIQF